MRMVWHHTVRFVPDTIVKVREVEFSQDALSSITIFLVTKEEKGLAQGHILRAIIEIQQHVAYLYEQNPNNEILRGRLRDKLRRFQAVEELCRQERYAIETEPAFMVE